MRFILVDGQVCIATHLTVDRERETQKVGSSTLTASKTVTVGESISGEMLLFRQGSLPEIFRKDGVVKKMDVEFVQDDAFYTLGDVIFTARRPMTECYEKCEAAYLEYAAMEVSVDRVTKDINRTVTI